MNFESINEYSFEALCQEFRSNPKKITIIFEELREQEIIYPLSQQVLQSSSLQYDTKFHMISLLQYTLLFQYEKLSLKQEIETWIQYLMNFLLSILENQAQSSPSSPLDLNKNNFLINKVMQTIALLWKRHWLHASNTLKGQFQQQIQYFFQQQDSYIQLYYGLKLFIYFMEEFNIRTSADIGNRMIEFLQTKEQFEQQFLPMIIQYVFPIFYMMNQRILQSSQHDVLLCNQSTLTLELTLYTTSIKLISLLITWEVTSKTPGKATNTHQHHQTTPATPIHGDTSSSNIGNLAALTLYEPTFLLANYLNISSNEFFHGLCTSYHQLRQCQRYILETNLHQSQTTVISTILNEAIMESKSLLLTCTLIDARMINKKNQTNVLFQSDSDILQYLSGFTKAYIHTFLSNGSTSLQTTLQWILQYISTLTTTPTTTKSKQTKQQIVVLEEMIEEELLFHLDIWIYLVTNFKFIMFYHLISQQNTHSSTTTNNNTNEQSCLILVFQYLLNLLQQLALLISQDILPWHQHIQQALGIVPSSNSSALTSTFSSFASTSTNTSIQQLLTQEKINLLQYWPLKCVLQIIEYLRLLQEEYVQLTISIPKSAQTNQITPHFGQSTTSSASNESYYSMYLQELMSCIQQSIQSSRHQYWELFTMILLYDTCHKEIMNAFTQQQQTASNGRKKNTFVQEEEESDEDDDDEEDKIEINSFFQSYYQLFISFSYWFYEQSMEYLIQHYTMMLTNHQQFLLQHYTTLLDQLLPLPSASATPLSSVELSHRHKHIPIVMKKRIFYVLEYLRILIQYFGMLMNGSNYELLYENQHFSEDLWMISSNHLIFLQQSPQTLYHFQTFMQLLTQTMSIQDEIIQTSIQYITTHKQIYLQTMKLTSFFNENAIYFGVSMYLLEHILHIYAITWQAYIDPHEEDYTYEDYSVNYPMILSRSNGQTNGQLNILHQQDSINQWITHFWINLYYLLHYFPHSFQCILISNRILFILLKKAEKPQGLLSLQRIQSLLNIPIPAQDGQGLIIDHLLSIYSHLVQPFADKKHFGTHLSFELIDLLTENIVHILILTDISSQNTLFPQWCQSISNGINYFFHINLIFEHKKQYTMATFPFLLYRRKLFIGVLIGLSRCPNMPTYIPMIHQMFYQFFQLINQQFQYYLTLTTTSSKENYLEDEDSLLCIGKIFQVFAEYQFPLIEDNQFVIMIYTVLSSYFQLLSNSSLTLSFIHTASVQENQMQQIEQYIYVLLDILNHISNKDFVFVDNVTPTSLTNSTTSSLLGNKKVDIVDVSQILCLGWTQVIVLSTKIPNIWASTSSMASSATTPFSSSTSSSSNLPSKFFSLVNFILITYPNTFIDHLNASMSYEQCIPLIEQFLMLIKTALVHLDAPVSRLAYTTIQLFLQHQLQAIQTTNQPINNNKYHLLQQNNLLQMISKEFIVMLSNLLFSKQFTKYSYDRLDAFAQALYICLVFDLSAFQQYLPQCLQEIKQTEGLYGSSSIQQTILNQLTVLCSHNNLKFGDLTRGNRQIFVVNFREFVTNLKLLQM